ncbi:MAG: hypothetical protein ACD_29C00137G0002 [uncultured bacterium]|nr:MAG: hypothetical protein ACD_29C00137G0002 [uncultured bacterium]
MLVVMFCGRSGTAPLVGIQAASVYSGFANFHMSAVLNASCNKIGRYVSMLSDEEHKFTVQTKQAAARNARIYASLLMKFCFLMSAAACGVAFLFSKQLATLIIDENNSAHQTHLATAITFLKIQGVFELISGVSSPTTCILEALLDNQFLFFATMIFELAANPGAAAAMHFGLHKSADWVFAASHAGSALMTLLVLGRCYSKFKGFTADPEATATASNEPTSRPGCVKKFFSLFTAEQTPLLPQETNVSPNYLAASVNA